MHQEQSVQAVRFTCWNCRNTWMTEYDVRHVEDGHGHAGDYYSKDGLPTVTPTTPGGIMCPQCGALRMTVRLEAGPVRRR